MISRPLQPGTSTKDDPRWVTVMARDAGADGQFYYSVKTTGIYCRPSCGARLPRPENVQFHLTREEAEDAGYRPCKRCKPDKPSLSEQHAEKITSVCRLIEKTESMPSLTELARHAGLSPYYFHRLFRAHTGLTPKSYAAAHRGRRLRGELKKSKTITDAIINSGYNSCSRFYENSNELLGMTPTSYRKGGANTDIRFAIGKCSLGSILVACSERGVCAVFPGDEPDALLRELRDRFPRANLVEGDSEFNKLVAQVIQFVDVPGTSLNLPLDIQGTAFQRRVWQALLKIPPGKTANYSDIARQIGSPASVRAVAQACAANKLAVVIPCHRVVKKDGKLSGYRWGEERKRQLLQYEAGNKGKK